MSTNLYLYIWLGALATQIIYFLLFIKALLKKDNEKQAPTIPVSVIICGRNESENFKKFLPLILEQEYPNFEVIAVNDQSFDNTDEVLEELANQYSHLKIVTVPETDQFWNGKKYALTLGIKAAKNHHLLFTDADCKPSSNKWIATLANEFNQSEIVLGYGGYQRKNTFTNTLIQWETLQTAIHYFSAAAWKYPYMGVGRNLGYTCDLFYKHKGFVKHMHIPSGDDDLFIQDAATKRNTSFSLSADSQTLSEPKETLSEWFHQKRRHLSTSRFYKKGHKFLLGFFFATLLLTYFGWIPGLFIEGYFNLIILALVGTRFLLAGVVYAFYNHKLSKTKAIWGFPIFEFSILLASITQQFFNLIYGKPKKWK